MNSLSWFLYFASALPNIATLGAVFAIFAACVWIVLKVLGAAISSSLMTSEYPSEEKPEGSADYRKSQAVFRASKSRLIVWSVAVGTVLAALIPSQKTFYMIAASEAAGTVISDPRTQGVFDDLVVRIRKELRLEETPATP